jgi:uncharacterized membrane protein YkoI
MIAVLLSGMAFAADKKIEKKDLPAAVQKAADEQVKGAEVVGYSKEVENGKTSYEVETKVGGHARDLEFDAKGTLLVVEEETPLDSIPAAAKAEIEKKAAGGTITKVETVTKGKMVSYEAQVKSKAGKKFEVTAK